MMRRSYRHLKLFQTGTVDKNWRYLAVERKMIRYFIKLGRNSEICGNAISRVMIRTSHARNQ
jgi:hypothetical protein